MSATEAIVADVQSAVGIGTAKIHVLEPFEDESAPGPVIHQVRSKDDAIAMCGVDVSKAVWAKRGPICVVCEDIEDTEFEAANPNWDRELGWLDSRPLHYPSSWWR